MSMKLELEEDMTRRRNKQMRSVFANKCLRSEESEGKTPFVRGGTFPTEHARFEFQIAKEMLGFTLVVFACP